MDFLLTIILGVILYLLVFLHRHFTKRRGYLETLGIPIDTPGFWLGSEPYAWHKYRFDQVQVQKLKKFGLTYGHYDGVVPTISTNDPELLKSILVKNFDSFTDTVTMEVNIELNVINQSVIFK